MHRLFVALRPPRAMRDQLTEAMGGVPGARWQRDEQLHLTLRFIGDVERPQLEDIASALAAIVHPRPVIALSGVGAFETNGRTHALWAGIAPDPGLKLLHDRIERALTGAGLAPEPRAYKPHITVARLSRLAGPVDPFLTRGAGLASSPVALDAFILFESHLGNDGAQYEAIARYPLR